MELFFMCIKIFLARILDVSIATLRQNVLHKDHIYMGTLLSFIEILIWFVVAREALVVAIDSIFIPISYSLGYATGTFLGMYFSKRWIGGFVGVQIVIETNNLELVKALKFRNYSFSTLSLSSDGRYQMIIIELKCKSYSKLKRIIDKYAKDSFVIVSDTKKVLNGIIK